MEAPQQFVSAFSSAGKSAKLGKPSYGSRPPATPWDATYQTDEQSLASSSSASSAPSLGSHSQKKRKAAKPDNTSSSGASWSKHRPRLSMDSPDIPASCDSNASTEDYMLSWSQSYAASRSSFSRRSSLDSDASFDSQLLCQEDMAEVEHHVPSPCSHPSSCSSASGPPTDLCVLLVRLHAQLTSSCSKLVLQGYCLGPTPCFAIAVGHKP